MNNISVTPKGGTLTSQLSGNQVNLTAPSVVKLNLNQSDIKSFARSNNDLIITTKSGEVVVIHNFYGPNGDSDLVLQDDRGALWWVEDPADGGHFVAIDSTDGLLAENSTNNNAIAAFGLGGAALAGIAAMFAGAHKDGGSGGEQNNGGGDNGGGSDTTPPNAATNLVLTDDVGTIKGPIINGTVTDDNIPTLTGTAEAGAVVKIYDGSTLLGSATVGADGTWSFTLPALADGQHSVTVTVTDAAGNVSTATSPITFTVDTAAPEAVGDVTASNNNGETAVPIAAGGVTNDNTPEISGKGEPGSIITITDGTTVLGSVVAGADGSWSFTSPALSDGSHTLSITSTDAAGNVSAATTITFTVDTTAPDAASDLQLENNNGDVSTPIAAGGVTNDNTPELSGKAEAGSTVSIYDGSTLLGTVTVGSDGTWHFTSPELGEGAHSLTTTVTDAAGNVSPASDPISFTVDTIAPEAASGLTVTDNVGDSQGELANGATTDDNTPTLAGQAEAGSIVTIYDGDTLLGSVTAGADGSWSFTTQALSNGAHSFTVTVTDAAGNVSPATDAFDINIDAGLPPATSSLEVTDDTGATLVQLANGAFTHDNTPTLSGLATANASIVIYNGDQIIGTATADADGQWVFDTSALPDGEYSFHAIATDVAGNTADSITINITIDTVAPDATGDLALVNDNGAEPVAVAEGAATNDNTPTLSGTAEAGAIVKVYDGSTLLGSVTADAEGKWSFTTPSLSDGNHSLTTTVTDAAGNTSAASDAYNFSVDTVPPVAVGELALLNNNGSVDVPIAANGITNDNTPELTGTAEAGAVITISNGDTVLGSVIAGSDGSWSFTSSTLADGTYTLSVTATDAAGNVSPATDITFTIDTVAPEAATLVSVTDDVGDAQGPLASGDTTDDSTPILRGTAEPDSIVKIYDGGTLLGSAAVGTDGNWAFTPAALSNGAHSFTITVTDAAGNVSAATPAFDLTVEASLPPATSSLEVTDDTGAALVQLADGAFTHDNTPTLSGLATPNASIVIYNGDVVIGSATADAAGQWVFDTTTLPDGSYAFHAVATDAAGNSADSVTINITIDTVAPEAAGDQSLVNDNGATPVVIADGSSTNDSTPTLSGTAEAGTVVKVYDGDTLLGSVAVDADGNWSFTTPELNDGSHSLTTTVTDAAGNVSAASDPITFTLDTVAPAAATDLQLVNDSGSTIVPITAGSDTSDNTPVLSGKAEAGDTVSIYDGTTLLGTVTVGQDGSWSFTVPTLSDGAHSLTTTVSDAAGNVSAVSDPLAFTVDTVAPEAITGLTVTDDVGDSQGQLASGATTDDNTPTFAGQAEAGTIVKIYDGEVLLGSTTVGSDGSWSFTPVALSNGAHSFTTTVTDAAGNVSPASAAFELNIDGNPPATTSSLEVTDDTGAILVQLADGAFTHDNTPTLSGAAPAGSAITLYNGTEVIGSATADANGQWVFDTTTLPDGTYAFHAVAVDPNGNSADSITITITIDTVAPEAAGDQTLVNDNGAAPVAIADGSVTNDNTPTLSGTAEAGSVVTVSDNGTVIGSTTVGSDGSWSFTAPALTDGSHSLTTTVTDAAGNVSAVSDPIGFTVDTQAPAAAGDEALTNADGEAIVDGDATNDTSPVLSGTAEAGSTVSVYDGTALLGTVTVGQDGNWSFTVPALNDGNHSLTTTVTDTAGNVSDTSAPISFTVDTVAPAPAGNEALTNADGVAIVDGGATNDSAPVLSGTAEAGSTVSVYDGTELLGTVTVGTDGSWSFTTPSLGDGAHSLTTTVTDAAGNVSPASDPISFTVDTVAPEAATDLQLANDSGSLVVPIAAGGDTNDSTPVLSGKAEAGSTVSVYDGTALLGTATVGQDGNWSFTVPALNDGAHSLTTTVTDAAGNVGPASEAIGFTVDTVAPEGVSGVTVTDNVGDSQGELASGATTDDNTPTFAGQAEAGAVVKVYDGETLLGSVTAGQDGSWSFTPDALSNGPHSFTTTVTDAAGNVSAESPAFDLTIAAGVPPTTSSLVVTDDTGATLVQLADGASTHDNTPTLNGLAGANDAITLYNGDVVIGNATADADGQWVFDTSTLPDGTYAFHAVATDAAGNTSDSVTITITIDTVAPEAAGDQTLVNDNGAAPVVIADGSATSDNTPTLSGTAEAGSVITVSDNGNVIGSTTVGSDGSWSFTTPTLSDGSHSLTTTVKDAAGNSSPASDPIGFTVDTQAPAAAGDEALTNGDGVAIADGSATNDSAPTLSGTAEAGSVVTISDNGNVIGSTAVGTDGSWSFTTPSLGDGGHSLTTTVTDAAGNVSPASDPISFTVDTLAPEAAGNEALTNADGVAIVDGGATNDSAPV
ncbi:Ig-like domain-containing protein, partial [Pantoea sp. A4]|uniref:Ig-like domain-containing protein n=1 Tax=Pantoea sp. A4 TaxID=1225184 RepID=UPI0003681DEB